jgi:hypothetical protein
MKRGGAYSPASNRFYLLITAARWCKKGEERLSAVVRLTSKVHTFFKLTIIFFFWIDKRCV